MREPIRTVGVASDAALPPTTAEHHSLSSNLAQPPGTPERAAPAHQVSQSAVPGDCGTEGSIFLSFFAAAWLDQSTDALTILPLAIGCIYSRSCGATLQLTDFCAVAQRRNIAASLSSFLVPRLGTPVQPRSMPISRPVLKLRPESSASTDRSR